MRTKRCHHPDCGGKLGLGAVSKSVWVPTYWWYQTYLFCSRKCRNAFLKAKADERIRQTSVAALFRPP